MRSNGDFLSYLGSVARWLVARAFDLRLNGREFETCRPLALPGSDLGQVTHTCVPLSPSSITWYRCKAGEVMAGCGSGVVYHP